MGQSVSKLMRSSSPSTMDVMESPHSHSDPTSPIKDSMTTLNYPSRKRESENEIISKLREEGIIPMSINKEGICFYVSMENASDQQIFITAKKRTLQKLNERRRRKSERSNEDKLSKAEELHQEKLREKGQSWRSYKDRFVKIKENQERKTEELRQKLEKKLQGAKERLVEKGNKIKKNRKVERRLQSARERREMLDKEFRQKFEQKLREDEERLEKMEIHEKPKTMDEKISRALYRREEYLKERQNIYLNKLKELEKSSRRRDEILKARANSPRSRPNAQR